MSIESERLKIEIASNYITGSLLNMAIFLVTTLVGVFGVLLAALLTHQIELDQVEYIGIPIEVLDLLAIVWQGGKFKRRLEYLDTLIENIESWPHIPLNGLKDIIKEIRKI